MPEVISTSFHRRENKDTKSINGIMNTTIVLLLLSLQVYRAAAFGLTVNGSKTRLVPYVAKRFPITHLYSTGDDEDDDSSTSDEGASLAADFFKALESRNIQLGEDDFIDDDEDNDEDEDDDEDDDEVTDGTTNESDDDTEEDEDAEEINIPDGALKAFTNFDEDAGNVTLTNEDVYSALKERAFESAGAFIDLVGAVGEEDESDDGEEGDSESKPYVTPETVPDSSLTAGEVVTTVLDALRNNDTPRNDRGIEVLFGYSSPGSIISQAVEDEGMTPSEYGEFLKEDNEYHVLFEHTEVIIDKGDYSFDQKKSFFTARLRIGDGPMDFTGVNFILSTSGNEEDDCWLVDSLLIRPEGMRRRRRR